MAESGTTPFTSSGRFRASISVVVLIALGVTAWALATRGRETTDDATVDARVTPMASRVGGVVLKVPVVDNQQVDAGTVLVELDPRDFQIAVEKARAELTDAEAAAAAAQHSVPITTSAANSALSAAQSATEQAKSAIAAAEREVEAARARLASAQARTREADANAARAGRDLERVRGLLAKDEISQQRFDAANTMAEAQRAATDSARSQVTETEASIHVAEHRLLQARSGEQATQAALVSARTAPEQVSATKARASSAQAQVDQAKATLAQAEANLQYAIVKAPARGIVSKKSVNPGQVVQPGQPLMALVETGEVWVTANFKETQLADMKPGQRATIKVDAYGDQTLVGRVESISAGTGARFSLLPAENATGNFVKVVQRVPVKIVLEGQQDPDRLLRPGMSVVPTVYTR